MKQPFKYDGSTQLQMLPTFHIYGFFLNLFYLYQGATTVLMSRSNLDTALNAIQQYKVTLHEPLAILCHNLVFSLQIRSLFTVPPVIVQLAKSPLVDRYDLSSLEWILSGAAPLGKDICDQLLSRFPNISVTQGLILIKSLLRRNLFNQMNCCFQDME